MKLKKIQATSFFIALFVCGFANAQISIAPHGTGGGGAIPPVGVKKSGSDCLSEGCLELVIKPSCFGTNLRAYSAKKQLRKNEDVVVDFKLMNPKTKNKDSLTVRFPASLTFDTGGARDICLVDEGQDMSKSGDKMITCSSPVSHNELKYRLLGWKEKKNPKCYANGGYKGREYCDYAGVTLEAMKYSGSDGDQKLNCLYVFKGNKINPSKVSCLFESDLKDRSTDVKVVLNGKDISSDAERKGLINKISAKIKGGLNSMNLASVARHGKLQPLKPARTDIKFYQTNGTEKRRIAALVESAGFDSPNGNRSFTLEVKHPGVKGFCGGFYSPLMVFFEKERPKFNGVSLFPLHGVEPGTRVNWPEAGAPGYFLVDLRGKDRVESHEQLFGRNDKHENGFESLAGKDENNDGVIDSKDSIFKKLKLWNDANGNGISEESELVSLSEKGLRSIDLNYNVRNPSSFGDRAKAREKSVFHFSQKGQVAQGEVYDVWLSPID